MDGLELQASSLARRYDPASFPCQTTEELQDFDEILGQPRAAGAIEVGLGIPGTDCGIFALGAIGTGARTTVLRTLQAHAAMLPVPPDRFYVCNFENPRCPTLIEVPAGQGAAFGHDMERLVEDVRAAIGAVFESSSFQQRRYAIEQEHNERPAKELAAIADRARAEGIGVAVTPSGFTVVPLREGEPLAPEEFAKLSAAERERLQGRMGAYQEDMQQTLRQVPRWNREQRERLRQLRDEAVGGATQHLFEELRAKHEAHPRIVAYLEAVRRDVIEHVEDLGDAAGTTVPELLLESLRQPFGHRRSLRRYRVNLIVDNAGQRGAPVIEDDNPSYESLCGRIEHLMQFGALVTDFALIKPGSLHRAHGGYLVLDAGKLLRAPFAWEGLKRALRAGRVHIEWPAEILGLSRTVTIEPEPASLDVKVVLVGLPPVYYLLSALDPEFGELFKMTADFAERMHVRPESVDRYVRLLATLARRERLLPLDRSALGRLLEHSARLAGDQDQLSLRFTPLLDLLREANYWAGRAGATVIGSAHLDRAIEAQVFRADRLRERSLEEIGQGTLRIDTSGARVGQVNGMSTVWLGSFCFARPSRITARVRLGQGQVVDIEREVELGGPVHSKGVLILAGYLGAHYSPDRPLSLAASLVFEQSYADIEGDSASVAELIALLSALADVPVKQSLAMTGSVSQQGDIQAVGAINEKVEGFFDACRVKGLTGEQGIVIPAANVRHLMLRRDVVEAVAAGSFHVYPVETTDEALELLTGRPAGRRDAAGEFPEGSVSRLVVARLASFAETWRAFNAPATDMEVQPAL